MKLKSIIFLFCLCCLILDRTNNVVKASSFNPTRVRGLQHHDCKAILEEQSLPKKEEDGLDAFCSEKQVTRISKIGNLKGLECLLEKGVDIVKETGQCHATTLMCASRGGQFEVVKYLLNMGADIDDVDAEEGSTALMYASTLDVAQILVDKGADIHRVNEEGWTALTYASDGNHLDIVQYLIGKGADIHHVDFYDHTAMTTASWRGNLDILQFLLDMGADINHVDVMGSTALIRASEDGALKTVKLLVTEGAGLNQVESSHGHTALIGASKHGHLEIVQYLLEAGANTTIRDKDGQTAFMIAEQNGHDDVANILLSSQLHKKDKNNKSKVLALVVGLVLGLLAVIWVTHRMKLLSASFQRMQGYSYRIDNDDSHQYVSIELQESTVGTQQEQDL